MKTQSLLVFAAPNTTLAPTITPICIPHDKKAYLMPLAAGVGTACVFLVIFIGACCLCWRMNKHRYSRTRLLIPNLDVQNALYKRLSNDDFYITPDHWEFDRKL